MQKKARLYKWLWIVICTVAIILITGNIIVSRIIPEKIRQQLSAIDPRIQIETGSIGTNIFGAGASLNEVKIRLYADSNRTDSAHLLAFKKIRISGIGLFSLLFHKELKISELLMEDGDAAFNKELLDRKKNNGLDYLSGLNFPFTSVFIDRLVIPGIRIKIFSGENTDLSLHADIAIHGIQRKKDSPDSLTSSPLSAFTFRLSEISYIMPGTAHSLKIKSVMMASDQDDWLIDSLKIIPAFSKIEFAKKIGHQTDRIDASIASIHIIKPDWRKFLEKKLIADRIAIGEMKLFIFRDRRIVMKEEVKPMPAHYLENIPVNTYVREILLKPSFVSYEEFPKDGVASGTLKIERLTMKIAPLTNHATAKPDHVDITVDGSIMGSGSVHSVMYVPLEKNKDYRVEGKFSNLLLTTLNESAENLGGFHIQSGMLNQLDFQFSMSEEKSTGKIVGEYHELVIEKLKKPSAGPKKKDWFKSFALRNFIIPKNKDKSMPEAKRTGTVDFKRDPNRYFSHYMLHSLLSGVKSSFTLGFLLPG